MGQFTNSCFRSLLLLVIVGPDVCDSADICRLAFGRALLKGVTKGGSDNLPRTEIVAGEWVRPIRGGYKQIAYFRNNFALLYMRLAEGYGT